MRWIVVVLAVIEAGWMLFDGTRAFVVGDFVTATTGPHAGELGPWTHVVEAVGIEPRSALMKGIFVACGGTWLAITVAFALRMQRSWAGMLAAAVATLWFLPIGTVFSALQIALLLAMPRTAR